MSYDDPTCQQAGMTTGTDRAMCDSTMTLGGPFDWLIDPDAPPLPVHRCEKAAGHKDAHTADGMTWTALMITVPMSV